MQRGDGMATAGLPEPEVLCSKLQEGLQGLRVVVQKPATSSTGQMWDEPEGREQGEYRFVQAELLVDDKVPHTCTLRDDYIHAPSVRLCLPQSGQRRNAR